MSELKYIKYVQGRCVSLSLENYVIKPWKWEQKTRNHCIIPYVIITPLQHNFASWDGDSKRILSLRTLKKTLSMRNLMKTLSMSNLKKTLSLRNLKRTLSRKILKRNPSLRNLKRTLSLRTLKRFRILNEFCAAKSVFGFLVMVYDRVGNGDKFSFENFALGKPRFHVIVTLKLRQKNVFSST